MTIEYRKTLNDVDLILNELTENETNRIPKKLRKFISDNKLKDYESNIRTDKPLEEQQLTSSTQAFLAMLYLNYWCANDEEKEELTKILSDNEKKYKKNLEEKYKVDNMFKKTRDNFAKRDDIIEATNTTGNTEIEIVKPNESVFKRIISKIFKLFKRK